MGRVKFMFYLWLSALRVSIARLRRGPLRPGWPWGYEVVTRAQKAFNASAARGSPERERRAWSSLQALGPASSQVRMLRREQAGSEEIVFSTESLESTGRVILYLHGGAFAYGSQRSHGELVAELALAAQARVVFPLYRLAPEHPFPAALDDAVSAYRRLLAAGVAPSSIVIAGDSAGGNLALSLLSRLRDGAEPMPAAAVLISPWVDLTARGGSLDRHQPFDWAEPWIFERWARHYLGDTPATLPHVSPGRAALHGLPPLLVVVGSAEMLYDQVLAMVEAAKGAGADVTLDCTPHMVHLWMTLAPWFSGFGAVIARMGDFVRAHAGKDARPCHLEPSAAPVAP